MLTKEISSGEKVFIEIYFEDLSLDAQKDLTKKLNTTPEEENWDVIPLATLEREV